MLIQYKTQDIKNLALLSLKVTNIRTYFMHHDNDNINF